MITQEEMATSEGRWVWCPEGWVVVPERATAHQVAPTARAAGLREKLVEAVYAEMLTRAPEPPSGWHSAKEPLPDMDALVWNNSCLPVLIQREGFRRRNILWDDWNSDHADQEGEGEFWTPLPPPPEK